MSGWDVTECGWDLTANANGNVARGRGRVANSGRWVPACYGSSLGSNPNIQNGRHKQMSGQHTPACQKISKKCRNRPDRTLQFCFYKIFSWYKKWCWLNLFWEYIHGKCIEVWSLLGIEYIPPYISFPNAVADASIKYLVQEVYKQNLRQGARFAKKTKCCAYAANPTLLYMRRPKNVTFLGSFGGTFYDDFRCVLR